MNFKRFLKTKIFNISKYFQGLPCTVVDRTLTLHTATAVLSVEEAKPVSHVRFKIVSSLPVLNRFHTSGLKSYPYFRFKADFLTSGGKTGSSKTLPENY